MSVLSESLNDVIRSLEEQNPWHGWHGYFSKENDAHIWSHGGKRYRVSKTKGGKSRKTPLRGRMRSQMSKRERRKADARKKRRKGLAADTGMPMGFNLLADELRSMIDDEALFGHEVNSE